MEVPDARGARFLQRIRCSELLLIGRNVARPSVIYHFLIKPFLMLLQVVLMLSFVLHLELSVCLIDLLCHLF
jgi:hypothetical protein